MLKKIILEHTIQYFQSNQWKELNALLERGREVRHLHVYADSILHPYDVAKIIEGYYNKQGFTLQREIGFLGHGKGKTNVYYVHPREDMAHFELFLNYDSDCIIDPANQDNTRQGINLEYWDDEFMNRYYESFQFKIPDQAEEKEILDYFNSYHWEQGYEFMTTEGIHSHVPVKTSIHPEHLKTIGIQSIQQKGWEISKVDSVVYSMKGWEQGKVTYLLKKPEIVVELDWEFDRDVIIKPRFPDLYLKMTEETFNYAIDGLDYYRLTNDDIAFIIENI